MDIKILELEENYIGEDIEGFSKLATQIQNAKELELLVLSKNSILNEQFKQIIDTFAERQRTVKQLSIADNLLGDGVEYFGSILATKEFKLNIIDLAGNSIPNDSLEYFAASLSKRTCEHLRTIKLQRNNIRAKTGADLLKAVVSNNREITIELEENPDCVQ